MGDYTFAPWKVGICGLYKRLEFAVVGPLEGRAVVLDDTCYFLPFATEADARASADALSSAPAREFLNARIFWDAKRPVNKDVLQSLDLPNLLDELGVRLGHPRPRAPQQQVLALHPRA